MIMLDAFIFYLLMLFVNSSVIWLIVTPRQFLRLLNVTQIGVRGHKYAHATWLSLVDFFS